MRSLVVGEVNGSFRSVFKKVAALHAKNHFNLAIIAGNLFAEQDDVELDELLNGGFNVPLPTYYTVWSRSLPRTVLQRLSDDQEVRGL